VLAEAFAAARSIADESSRARALAGLAPYLRGELLAEALVGARLIANDRIRADVLGHLTPHLKNDNERKACLSDLLALAPKLERAVFIQHLTRALPIIVELGGLRELHRAIVDTADWWP
jgi:hypothetical protein